MYGTWGKSRGQTSPSRALPGNPSFISLGYSDLHRVLSDGSIVYATHTGRDDAAPQAEDHREAASAQTSYPVFDEGISFRNEYDYLGNPLVLAPEGFKRVKLFSTYYEVTPLGLDQYTVSLDIKRNDLMNLVYPFQWIQGDYNGDGKTDIGIFHCKGAHLVLCRDPGDRA